MTQRGELAAVIDRLAVDQLITDYAIAVEDGDWPSYQGLFTPDGRADHRSAGGIEGDSAQVAAWLAESLRPFPVRQHLIVNRRLDFGVLEQDRGDTARVRAGYLSPMRRSADGPAGEPDLVSGGRYSFGLLRTEDGWRLSEVVADEQWRRAEAREAADEQSHRAEAREAAQEQSHRAEMREATG